MGLAEQKDVRTAVPAGGIDDRSHAPARASHTRLGQGRGKPPLGHVVGRRQEARLHGRTAGPLDPPLQGQIYRRRLSRHPAVNHLEVLAAAQFAPLRSQQHYQVPFRPEPRRGHPLHVLQQPHHGHRRRGVDGRPVGLVVEADVAAHHRNLQGQAGFAHAEDRLGELPHHLFPFRVAEVQAVREPQRRRAHAGQVPGRFHHRGHAARVGVQVAIPAVAVHGQGESPGASLDADHGRVRTRGQHRVAAHVVVVLAVDGFPGGEVGGLQEPLQRPGHVLGLRQRGRVQALYLVLACGPGRGAVMDRRGLGQRGHRNRGRHAAFPQHPEHRGVDDPAHRHRVQVPTPEDLLHLRHRLRTRHQEHALLGLGQQDLVGGHPRLPQRHLGELQLHP